MRGIVAGLFMTLDGVVESPEQWGFQYFDDQLVDEISTGIARADSVLIGRRTYQEFAEMWPSQGSDVLMADFLNRSHKYVVSTSLDTLDWGPASFLTGDLADELMQLKQLPGENIQVPGSPTLVRSLLRDGLLDELSLSICPIVVGSGMRLFEDVTDQLALEVARAATFRTGVLSVTYRPASAPSGEPARPVLPGPETS
jgi:dihydrofolate reductase